MELTKLTKFEQNYIMIVLWYPFTVKSISRKLELQRNRNKSWQIDKGWVWGRRLCCDIHFSCFALYFGTPPISQIFKKVKIVKNLTQVLSILPALFHSYLFSQFYLLYILVKDLILNLRAFFYWKLFDNFSFTGKNFYWVVFW